jgi:hypothetical protein
MSAALKRRSTSVVLPTPKTIESEIEIVAKRVRELASNLQLKAKVPTAEAIEKVVTIFRELRTGQTLDGKAKLKTPSGVLSTRGGDFGARQQHGTRPATSAAGRSAPMTSLRHPGLVVKDEEKDKSSGRSTSPTVLKKRGAEWRPLYTACSEQND